MLSWQVYFPRQIPSVLILSASQKALEDWVEDGTGEGGEGGEDIDTAEEDPLQFPEPAIDPILPLNFLLAASPFAPTFMRASQFPALVADSSSNVDAAAISPHVAGPSSTKISAPLTEMEEKKVAIQEAYLVSCTNLLAADIAAVAEVFETNPLAKLAPGVELYNVDKS
ncbi:hypothetical protein B9Z19DRAFT_1128521 [Tuber borchii]|uniref:Uncharacterized protein n=1 Tax=Tuber borchii TaxID=42251 RepID=A0A2T6ZP45_TUBBO|nr:hypothetical protein B9Z19DRAFT_1128521 [Tuber borchii]